MIALLSPVFVESSAPNASKMLSDDRPLRGCN